MRAGSSIVDLIPYDSLEPGDIDIFTDAEPAPAPLFDRESPHPMIGAPMHDLSDILEDLQSEIGAAPRGPARQAHINRAKDKARRAMALRQKMAALRKARQSKHAAIKNLARAKKLARLKALRTKLDARKKAFAARAVAATAAAAAASAKAAETQAAAAAAPENPQAQASAAAASSEAAQATQVAERTQESANRAENAHQQVEQAESQAESEPEEAEEAAPEEAAEDAPPDETVSGDMSRGFWVKTRFYQEGPFLKSTTTCVSCGNVEVLNFSVDLRPIARAVVAYHQRMHRNVESARTKPMGLKPKETAVSGFFNPIDAITSAVSSVAKAPFGAAEKFVRTAKKAAKSLAKAQLTKMITGAMADLAKRVGSYAGTFTGFDLVSSLIKGERIDHALMGEFKAALKVTKDLAPYAQMVVATVPGVGTGIAAGIAGAAALAEGRPIDDALIAAGRAALPGGPVAQAAFDVGRGIAKGQRIDKIALQTARNQLPEDQRKAFDVGVALSHGKVLQAGLAAGGSAAGKKLLASIAPKGLEKMDAKTLEAHVAATGIITRLESGAHAKSALENVGRSRLLVDKTRAAMKKVGIASAMSSLKSHPALAQRLRRAVLVTTAAKNIPQAAFQAPLTAAQQGLQEIAKIVAASKSSDPKTREAGMKSLAVLKIVAEERARVASIVSAHGGGVPGMFIDRKGKIVRGNFVHQVSSQSPKNTFFSRHGIRSGHFTRLPSPEPASRPPSLSPVTQPVRRPPGLSPVTQPVRRPPALSPATSPIRRTTDRPVPRVSGESSIIVSGTSSFQQARAINSRLRLKVVRSGQPVKSVAVQFNAQRTTVSGAIDTLIGCPPRVGLDQSFLVGCEPEVGLDQSFLVGCGAPRYR